MTPEQRACIELFGTADMDIGEISPDELFYHYSEQITFAELVQQFREMDTEGWI